MNAHDVRAALCSRMQGALLVLPGAPAAGDQAMKGVSKEGFSDEAKKGVSEEELSDLSSLWSTLHSERCPCFSVYQGLKFMLFTEHEHTAALHQVADAAHGHQQHC